MISKIQLTEFLRLSEHHIVLDVRSPGEYAHAHIPEAINMPLFSDEERKVVGTAYKQQSRETAIKIGLDYFGVKMRAMIEQLEILFNATVEKRRNKTVLVHCWRGGMRSAGVAWLLDLYGYKVYTLSGGYKAFRQEVFQTFSRPRKFCVLGGNTGSGKTLILHELARTGHNMIDLEGIANHKGSAFGGIGLGEQPSQEMFENMLAVKLNSLSADVTWIEDESRRVGNVNLPEGLWAQMRNSPLYFFDIPIDSRLEHIVADYGKIKKEELIAAIMRIRKRLGGLATKQSIDFLLDDKMTDAFRILLQYYDKFYMKGIYEKDRSPSLVTKIESKEVSAINNAAMLLSSCQC